MNFRIHALLLILLPASVIAADRPNILLLSIDDLNDWTGCLGGHPQAKTPNIDRLAKRGTLFTNAHCQSPVCNPLRASLLTGRYPHTSGVYFLGPDLKKAPVLQGSGHTAGTFRESTVTKQSAAGKIFHTGDKRFFQEYGGNMGGFGPRPKKKISQPHGHPLWDWGAYPEQDEEMPDHKIASWAARKLQSIPADSDEPFLMGVGFYRPHVPMFAPKSWFDKFPRNEIKLPLVKNDDRNDLSDYAIALTNDNHVSPEHSWVVSAREWDHAVQAYLASTAFADHCLGMVLDALDASPHKDNTIIVLFADHGFHLGEKQRWAKRTIWEDGTRVPLIVSAPDYKAGQRTTKPAQLLDIFPTLLDLAGPARGRRAGREFAGPIDEESGSRLAAHRVVVIRSGQLCSAFRTRPIHSVSGWFRGTVRSPQRSPRMEQCCGRSEIRGHSSRTPTTATRRRFRGVTGEFNRAQSVRIGKPIRRQIDRRRLPRRVATSNVPSKKLHPPVEAGEGRS